MTELLSALVLLASGALAPRVDVTVAPRELTVGDRAEVTVSVKIDDQVPNGAVSWPAFEENLGAAEVLEVGPIETTTLANGDRILTRTVGITFFEVGQAVVPTMEVEISTASGPNVLATDEIPLSVISVLPEGEAEPEAKPPAPPRSLAIGERFFWASGALLATCLMALALLARQASSTGTRRPEIVLTARQELANSLEALRGEQDTDRLHEGVSMTTRRYLGRVLDFPAPESTTSEVDRELRRRGLTPELTRRTHRLLSACDMVMFARRSVELDRGRERIDEVEALADAVDHWKTPPEATEEAAATAEGQA